MASTSESGHATNVANFEKEILACTSFGAAYDPVKPALKLLALNALLTSASTALSAVNGALPAWINTVNARELAFAPLNKLCTRILNALDASDVDNLIVLDARTIIRKIQGRRASPRIKDDPATPENESLKSISASQMSFVYRVENFEKLIALLKAQPNYNPNEVDLKIITLTALAVTLRSSITDVTNTATTVYNARIARDTILYTKDTGLISIAEEVKKYVKSVFGGISAEYKLISKLIFKKPYKVFI